MEWSAPLTHLAGERAEADLDCSVSRHPKPAVSVQDRPVNEVNPRPPTPGVLDPTGSLGYESSRPTHFFFYDL